MLQNNTFFGENPNFQSEYSKNTQDKQVKQLENKGLKKSKVFFTENNFSPEEIKLKLSEKSFTKVKSKYAYHKGFVSLNDIVSVSNSLKGNLPKSDSVGCLTGCFKPTGKSPKTKDIYKRNNFLPFDIDVNDHSNQYLFNNPGKRKELYKELSKFTVMQAYSNSKTGLYGYLYVKGLDKFNFDSPYNRDVILHHYSELVYKYLEDFFAEYNVSFDRALGKLRQIRYFAPQENKVSINKAFYVFEVPKYYPTIKVKKLNFTKSKKETKNETVSNNNLDKYCESVLNNEAEKITNASSVHTEVLRASTNIGCYINGGLIDKYTAVNTLQNAVKSAYTNQNRKVENSTLKAVISGIETAPGTVTKEDLQERLTAKDSKQTTTGTKTKEKTNKYPLVDKFKADVSLDAKRYVSEISPEIIKFINNNQKTLIQSPTDSGKTYAMCKEIAPGLKGKTIILQPLVSVTEQTGLKYKIPYLTGESNDIDKNTAITEALITTTYEQGLKLIGEFDNIIFDEAHGITNDTYRNEVISKLLYKLEQADKKVIFLTATPHNLFTEIGFKSVSIKLSEYKPETVIFRKGYSDIWNTLNEHEKQRKNKGIAIYKVQSKDKIKAFRKQLIKQNKYKSDEILMLYSDEQIKKHSDYNLLIEDEIFSKNTKIVLATSFINSGLNINDKRVSEVVNIESNYYANPDEFKQFIARVRSESNANVKYYTYFKIPENQKTLNKKYNACLFFRKELQKLNNNANDINKGIRIFDSYNITKAQKDRFKSALSEDNQYVYDNVNNVYSVNIAYVLQQARKNEYENFDYIDYMNYLKVNQNLNFIIEIEADKPKVKYDKSELKEMKIKAENTIYKAFAYNLTELILFVLYNSLDSKFIKLCKDNGYIKKLINPEMFAVLPNKDFLLEHQDKAKLILQRYFYCKSIEMPEDAIPGLLFKEKNGTVIFNLKKKYTDTIHLIKFLLLFVYGNKNDLHSIFEKRQFEALQMILSALRNMRSFGTSYVSINHVQILIKNTLYRRKNDFFKTLANTELFVNAFFDVKTQGKHKIKLSEKSKNAEDILQEICNKNKLKFDCSKNAVIS